MLIFHRLTSVITVWLTVAATLFAGLPRVTCGCTDSSSKPLCPDSSARLSSCCCGGACCSGSQTSRNDRRELVAESASPLTFKPKHSCCAQAPSRSAGTVQARTPDKRSGCARMIAPPPTIAFYEIQKVDPASAAPVSGLSLSPHLRAALSSSTLQLLSAHQAPQNSLTLLMHLVI